MKSAPQDLEANFLAQTGPTLTLGHPMETSGSICLQRAWSKKGGQQQANQVRLIADAYLAWLIMEELRRDASYRYVFIKDEHQSGA